MKSIDHLPLHLPAPHVPAPQKRRQRSHTTALTAIAARCFALCAAALLILSACSRATPTPEPTPPPAPQGGSCSLDATFDNDEAAIDAVLRAEGEFVVAQQIDPLLTLWLEEGRVIDAKNTPDDAEDDQAWDGIDAIRHRYVRTVFPGAPAAVQHVDQEITIADDRATVVASTEIGAEVSPGGDRWELAKRDGCWYLAALTYNLEP